jgi:hypothetical protein
MIEMEIVDVNEQDDDFHPVSGREGTQNLEDVTWKRSLGKVFSSSSLVN